MSMLTAVRETLSGFKSLIIGMKITAKEAVKPIITVQYPRETLAMPARFRGHIQLVLDPETGRPRCTACTLCAKACPSGCIELDGIKREGDKKKSVSKYMLDFSKCSLCGSCVEVCPSDAIEFSRQYNVVSLSRSTFDAMDLYADIEKKSAAWTAAHPAPVVAAVGTEAGCGAPALQPTSAATPLGVGRGLSPTEMSGVKPDLHPATATPPPHVNGNAVAAGTDGRAGTPFPADAGAERSPRPTPTA